MLLSASFLGPGYLESLFLGLLLIIPFWQIFKKSGYPKALSILMIVPLVNIVVLYVFAFKHRPEVSATSDQEGTVEAGSSTTSSQQQGSGIYYALATLLIIFGVAIAILSVASFNLNYIKQDLEYENLYLKQEIDANRLKTDELEADVKQLKGFLGYSDASDIETIEHYYHEDNRHLNPDAIEISYRQMVHLLHEENNRKHQQLIEQLEEEMRSISPPDASSQEEMLERALEG